MIKPSSFFEAAISFGMGGPEGTMEIGAGLGFGLLFAAEVALANAATATAAINDAIISQRAEPFFGACGTTSGASSRSVSKEVRRRAANLL
jgi:hypothetical protein